MAQGRALFGGRGCAPGGRRAASSGPRSYDVVVVGGGVMGSWAASRVAARGASCALLDQFDPGHDRGSSHGDGRVYRFAYEEDEYVDMMQYSLGLWQDLQAHAGHPLMAKTGGINVNWASARGSDADPLTKLQAMYSKRGAAHEVLTAVEVRERFPQYGLPEGMEALYQPDMGVLFATQCVKAAWSLAGSLGAELRPNTRVTGLARDGRGAVVKTASGEALAARHVVLAPGGWLSGMARALLGIEIPTRVTAETVSYFAVRDGCSLDHSYRSMPVFLSTLDNKLTEYGFYGLPSIDVPGVKVSAHYAGPIVDPDDRPQSAGGGGAAPDAEEMAARRVAEVIEANKRIVATQFPGLEPEPFLSQNCLYTSTPDHDYILDRVPGFDAVVLAGGGSGHAFKMGPAIGELCACLALGREPSLQVGKKFSLQRLLSVPPGATSWSAPRK